MDATVLWASASSIVGVVITSVVTFIIARGSDRTRRREERAKQDMQQLASFRTKSWEWMAALEGAIKNLEPGSPQRATELLKVTDPLKSALRASFDHSRLGRNGHTHQPRYTLTKLLEEGAQSEAATLEEAAARTMDALDVLTGAVLDILNATNATNSRIADIATAASRVAAIRQGASGKIQQQLQFLGGDT